MEVSFTEENVLNELIDTASNDMEQRYSDNTENFPWGNTIFFIG